ncbi:ECF transporter S component [Thermococcus sp.]|uniref:ECF transporter S component n=1 Tax=Thermococcus sp. TaxID=35749 RepID=UPI00261AD248|nr:ECF transporter S component [Thermococcus sp.]
MVDLTEILKPYGWWVLGGVTVLYIAYVYANRKKFRSASTLALSGILAALVTVATTIIRVPTPTTGGYLNFGDTMVMFSAMVFGPVIGVFAGGVGSALGDITGGYPGWAPITLVVKGLEGLLVGYIAMRGDSTGNLVVAGVVGGTIMVLGYLSFEAYMFGIPVALTEVPGNTLQAVTGILVGTALAKVIKKRYPEVLDLI